MGKCMEKAILSFQLNINTRASLRTIKFVVMVSNTLHTSTMMIKNFTSGNSSTIKSF